MPILAVRFRNPRASSTSFARPPLAHFGRSQPGQRFADWTRRFILFHGQRHPRDLGIAEITRFLEHLGQTEKDPLGALEQAREALDFLYGRLRYANGVLAVR